MPFSHSASSDSNLSSANGFLRKPFTGNDGVSPLPLVKMTGTDASSLLACIDSINSAPSILGMRQSHTTALTRVRCKRSKASAPSAAVATV